ncbi:hypothetical protein OKW51_000883 [Pseudomonas hunanensis]|nr:hypothetical protein [Pseudomonas hunanensis]
MSNVRSDKPFILAGRTFQSRPAGRHRQVP